MATKAPVYFFFESTGITLRDRTRLKGFIRKLMVREGRKLESVNYIFVSDKRLLEINRQFLKHDYYTDIITFDLTPSTDLPAQAEIYISLDRVRDNAKTQGELLTQELHRVIFHGALHLCGYRDKTSRDATVMRRKEEEWLLAYFGR